MTVLTKQDIFTTAVRGLAQQGWDRCELPSRVITYAFGDRHSPWGWVDLRLDKEIRGSVYYLRQEGVGLASDTNDDQLALANRMELMHALAPTALAMRRSFRKLAFELGLRWPGDVA